MASCWSTCTSHVLPPVYLARSDEEAELLIATHFPPGSACGFDVEWKPTGWPPGSRPHPDDGKPALLQLSSPSAVVLLQLLQLRRRWPLLPAAYVALASDPQSIFLGRGIHADLELLHGHGGALTAAVVDLDAVALRSGLFEDKARQLFGLSRLTALLGGPQLKKPKKVQLSNWAARSLSPGQVRYAALDAWAGGWIAGELFRRSGEDASFHEWLHREACLPGRREMMAASRS
jgi:hypothetical protein